PAAHDIRWQRDQGATRLAVVEMVSGKVGVNDALAARLACHPFGRFGLPGFGRVGAKESTDSLGIEFILVPEMPVEALARQTGILHDFVDRDLGESPFVE